MFLVSSCSCLCSIHWSQVLKIKNEYVVSTAPVGAAPTTSKWSANSLLTKVGLMLEILWYCTSTPVPIFIASFLHWLVMEVNVGYMHVLKHVKSCMLTTCEVLTTCEGIYWCFSFMTVSVINQLPHSWSKALSLLSHTWFYISLVIKTGFLFKKINTFWWKICINTC